jgi:hypothetical protein
MTRRSFLNLESLESRVTPATTKGLVLVVPPPVRTAAVQVKIVQAPVTPITGGQGLSPAIGVVQGTGSGSTQTGGGSGLDSSPGGGNGPGS